MSTDKNQRIFEILTTIFWVIITFSVSAISNEPPKISEIENILNSSKEMKDYLIQTDEEERIKVKDYVVGISTIVAVTSLSGKTKYLLFVATRTITDNDYPVQNIAGVYLPQDEKVIVLASGFNKDFAIRQFFISKNTDYVLVEGVCGRYDWRASSRLFEFDEFKKSFTNKFDFPYFEHVVADGCESSSNYIDRANLKYGEWLDNGFREIIAEISREDLGSNPPEEIKKIVEHYSWIDNKLYLAEKVENEKVVLSRQAAKRLLKVNTLCEQDDIKSNISLLDFLGDENEIVRSEAHRCLYVFYSKVPKSVTTEDANKLIYLLILKASDPNDKGWNEANTLLWNWDIKLNPNNHQIIWEKWEKDKTNETWLRLLVKQKDKRVLKTLYEWLEKAIEEKNACRVEELSVYYIRNLIGSESELSDREKSIFKKAIKANLICEEGYIPLNVSKNIAEWLNLLVSLPSGCAPRENFPGIIQEMFPVRDKFSGLQIAKGSCQDTTICRNFTQKQIRELLIDILQKTGQFINDDFLNQDYFLNQNNDSIYNIGYCRLESDYIKLMNELEEKTILSSKYNEQKELRDFLSNMLGEWCGLTPKRGHRERMQLRISFIQDKNIIKGVGTITWGNIGDPNYVNNIILIPISYKEYAGGSTKEVLFSEVSQYTTKYTSRLWYLRKFEGIRDIVHIVNDEEGDVPLSPNCDGFWKKEN